MSSSGSSSTSSSVDESGILDDVLGNNNGGSSVDDKPPRKQSDRTRQRRLESYGGSIKKFKLNKRLYPTASSPLIQQSNDDVVTQQPKTELEKKVLSDCLSNHFLLASRCDSTKRNNNRRSSYIYAVTPGEKEEKDDCDADDGGSLVMIETLVSRFERVNFRRNEIIFEEGDPANYLYVLCRGDVLVRSRNEATGTTVLHHSKDNGDNNDDGNNKEDDEEEDSDDKYTILGELELLTNLRYAGPASGVMSSPLARTSYARELRISSWNNVHLLHSHSFVRFDLCRRKDSAEGTLL